MINEKLIKKYCCEDIKLIKNYQEANNSNEMWDCHHCLEIQGDKRYSVSELIKLNLYYNRPASELILLTRREHSRLHSIGKKLNKITKQKISDANKGKTREHKEKTKIKISETLKQYYKEHKSHNYGKHYKYGSMTEEHKNKISDSHIGKKLKKFKWLTPLGEIKEMDISNVHRWHKDWILYK